MSFSSDVKTELTSLQDVPPCCLKAEAYGMAQCGRAFSAARIALQTEQEAVARGYAALLASCCGVEPEATLNDKSGVRTLRVESRADRKAVLGAFGHEAGEVTARLNRANLDCDNCAAAWLRGAFLACGAVQNPEKEYHLEFTVPFLNLSRDAVQLLGECGLAARTVRRKGSYVVYFKDSEAIEDCLTLMGAVGASLDLMNVKIVKDVRNKTNRIVNCESANIDKTVGAAAAQVLAVERIERLAGLAALPEELRTLAALRRDNPDMSLRELGEALTPPVSRSGVNHRLKRIQAFADSLKDIL